MQDSTQYQLHLGQQVRTCITET